MTQDSDSAGRAEESSVYQHTIQPHDHLDVSSIEMKRGAEPKITFVTVPPFERSISYDLVVAGKDTPVVELAVFKSDGRPPYYGYVTFGKPVNLVVNHPPFPGQNQADPLRLLLRFKQEMSDDHTTIEFYMLGCFLDVFDDRRLYFRATSNTITTRGRTFTNIP